MFVTVETLHKVCLLVPQKVPVAISAASSFRCFREIEFEVLAMFLINDVTIIEMWLPTQPVSLIKKITSNIVLNVAGKTSIMHNILIRMIFIPVNVYQK